MSGPVRIRVISRQDGSTRECWSLAAAGRQVRQVQSPSPTAAAAAAAAAAAESASALPAASVTASARDQPRNVTS